MLLLALLAGGCNGCGEVGRAAAWQVEIRMGQTCRWPRDCKPDPARCPHGGPDCKYAHPAQIGNKGVCRCLTEEEARSKRELEEFDAKSRRDPSRDAGVEGGAR